MYVILPAIDGERAKRSIVEFVPFNSQSEMRAALMRAEKAKLLTIAVFGWPGHAHVFVREGLRVAFKGVTPKAPRVNPNGSKP